MKYCGLCLLSFYTNEDLKNHRLMWHKSSYNLKCDKCERRFYNIRTLNLHKGQKHTKLETYKQTLKIMCRKCKIQFSSKHCLRKHYKNIHKSTI